MPFYDLLIYQPEAIVSGEVWRLLTGQLLHINTEHFLYNVTALVMLYFIAKKLKVNNFFILLVWCLILTGLNLFFIFPEVVWYVGASGFLHGIFLILSVQIINKVNAIFGFILIIGLVSKLLYEYQFGAITNMDIVVITQAHLSGVLAGLYIIIYLNLKQFVINNK